MKDVALAIGVKVLTDWGTCLPSSPPIFAQIECYTLIDAYGACIPRLDKIAHMSGSPSSDNGRCIPIECRVGRQVM